MLKLYKTLLRVALHRPKLAAEVLYWRLIGKRKHALHGLRAAPDQLPHVYRQWIALVKRRPEVLVKAAQQ